jgi:hypothetical protein
MLAWKAIIKLTICVLIQLLWIPGLALAYQLPLDQGITSSDTIVKFNANPALGFNYAYFI